MKYRKKPIIVEAIEVTWQNWDALCNLIPKRDFIAGVYLDENGNETEHATSRLGVKFKTIERNEVIAECGDYVVIDIAGYPYPCNKGVFEAGHEKIGG